MNGVWPIAYESSLQGSEWRTFTKESAQELFEFSVQGEVCTSGPVVHLRVQGGEAMRPGWPLGC